MKAGKLPQVSWIAAPEAFTEHPNWPANYGAWYISQVLDALTSNPEVWSKTALFITYDENDGFFDHVVPPFPPASAAQGLSTVDVALDLLPGRQRPRRRPLRPRPARARCSSSRPGARAATSAPRPSTTPRSSGSWSAASACTSRTSRRGGARSAAT